MSPRIAYVINSVEGGGAALPVPALATLLRRMGFEVTVLALTRRDGRALAPMEAAGLEVVVRPGGERDHPAAIRWLDDQVRRRQPTLLWTSLTRATLLGQLVGWRRRVPVVSWQHAAWLRPANLRLLRASHHLTALWVADSRSVAGFCHDRIGIPQDRLAIWPIFRADPSRPVATAWRPGEPIRLGSLGRLHPVKGYDALLAALARLRLPVPIAVAIGGDGAERAALQAQALAAGLRHVEFSGFVVDPQAWLTARHLYLQPSRSEGFCVSAHEAMLAGLPVIGSAVGEMARSIRPGAIGWLVPPGDPAALATAIADALAAPDRLAAMGVAARAEMLDRFGPAAFDAAGAAVVDRLPVTRGG